MAKKNLTATSVAALHRYWQGRAGELPGWTDDKPFRVAPAARALTGMIRAGRIPQPADCGGAASL